MNPIALRSGTFPVIATLIGSMLCGGHTFAQSIYSLNSVAYFDSSFAAGSNLVANPLVSTNNSISNLFRGLPSGSFFLPWNPATQSFGPTNRYNAIGGWTDGGVQLLKPSGGFLWLPSPALVSFVGEVGGPNNCINFPTGYSVNSLLPQECCCFCVIGPCPADYPPDTRFSRWNRVAQAYEEYIYIDFGPEFPSGWYDSNFNPVEPELAPDEAGLILSPQSFSGRILSPQAIGGGTPLCNIAVELVRSTRNEPHFSFQFWAPSPMEYFVSRNSNLNSNGWELFAPPASAAAGWVTVTDSNTPSQGAYYRVDSFHLTLHNPARTGATFSFQFCAQPGVNYRVERKRDFTAPAWETVFITNGVGLLTVIDHHATNSSGYYRLRR